MVLLRHRPLKAALMAQSPLQPTIRRSNRANSGRNVRRIVTPLKHGNGASDRQAMPPPTAERAPYQAALLAKPRAGIRVLSGTELPEKSVYQSAEQGGVAQYRRPVFPSRPRIRIVVSEPEKIDLIYARTVYCLCWRAGEPIWRISARRLKNEGRGCRARSLGSTRL